MFIGYWNAVDAALLRLFALDTSDSTMDADQIAEAQEQGWTPEELARWYGDTYRPECIISYDTNS
jgi:hypothetical protein